MKLFMIKLKLFYDYKMHSNCVLKFLIPSTHSNVCGSCGLLFLVDNGLAYLYMLLDAVLNTNMHHYHKYDISSGLSLQDLITKTNLTATKLFSADFCREYSIIKFFEIYFLFMKIYLDTNYYLQLVQSSYSSYNLILLEFIKSHVLGETLIYPKNQNQNY